MARDLAVNGQMIADRLTDVIALAPQVVNDYRAKLLERVRTLLQGSEAHISDTDLIREVSIYADRSDINEEIKRLQCHLEQFTSFLNEKASAGRKLDFLSQEIFREVNTIGSKANSVAIAHSVLVIIYHMLRDKRPYADLGPDYFDQLDAARLQRHHVRRLEQLGYTVTLQPQEAA